MGEKSPYHRCGRFSLPGQQPDRLFAPPAAHSLVRGESGAPAPAASIRRPDGRPRLAFEFLPRRCTWSEPAGRFAHIVKCARMLRPVSWAPEPQPHFIRGPGGRHFDWKGVIDPGEKVPCHPVRFLSGRGVEVFATMYGTPKYRSRPLASIAASRSGAMLSNFRSIASPKPAPGLRRAL